MNKILTTTLLGVTSLLLTSCVTLAENLPSSGPELGEWDSEVAEFLPKGPYLVEGKAYGKGKENDPYFTINGYVNFVDEIDGVGCESRYDGVFGDGVTAFTSGLTVVEYTTIRNPGERAWRDLPVGWTEDPNINKKSEPKTWYDVVATEPPDLFSGFIPDLVSTGWMGISDGSADGLLCAIQLLPRYTSLIDGQIVGDDAEITKLNEVKLYRAFEQTADACGVSGYEKTKALNYLTKTGLYELAKGEDGWSLWEGKTLTITKLPDNAFEIKQENLEEEIAFKLEFTPTEKQTIETVSGVKSEEKECEKADELRAEGYEGSELLRKIWGLS